MKLRHINVATLIFLALLFSSFAFFTVAQEKSVTRNNLFLDSDQDNLTDAEEKLYGTDPYNHDTDSDGYSDGAEVAAGYDPLKPAPGDKLSDENKTNQNGIAVPNSTVVSDSTNLTQELAKRISFLASQSSDPDNPQVSADQVNQVVNDALNSQDTSVTLPQIDPASINVKKQNYSTKTATAKKKEDFLTYISSVFYIFSSNSPTPITSSSDMTSALSQTAQQIITSIASQNTTALDKLTTSGQAILTQLKEVEVPEDLVNLHIEALRYATYAAELKDSVKTDSADPMASIVNYSKIGVFVQSLSSFVNDAQDKMDSYDVNYSDIQARMKNYGIDLPDSNDLGNALESASKNASTN